MVLLYHDVILAIFSADRSCLVHCGEATSFLPPSCRSSLGTHVMAYLDKHVLKDDCERRHRWLEEEKKICLTELKSCNNEWSVGSQMMDQWMLAKEAFSEVGAGKLKVIISVSTENTSSRSLMKAIALSISLIVNIFHWGVAPNWFRRGVECHIITQKLQPRSVFKL